ncbi:hypothetical protein [Georgenia daeguensis]|uniref:DUF222 domain-containing protein n=1 Tax=Georgenia daeguensis TaxID=908355 RepID=A0ABP8EYJ3_9MICO
MSYRQHSAELAQHMAVLTITGASHRLDNDGLDAALLARRATLDLIRQTVATATENPAPAAPPAPRRPGLARGDRVAQVEDGPVRDLLEQPTIAYQRTLAAYPAPPAQLSLGERGATAPEESDPTTESWFAIAKAATLALHDFSDLPQLEDEHRWTVVADAAAIGRTLYVLDGHLLEAAEALADLDPMVLADLRRTRDSAMPLAAEEASALAHGGPLPDLDTVPTEPQTTTPVRVNSPRAAVEGQARLRRQLTAAKDISPDVLGYTAWTQAQLMGAAAHLLKDHDPGRARLAATISDQLLQVRLRDPQVAALAPGSRLPLNQSAEIKRYLDAAMATDPTSTDADHVRRSMSAIVDHSPGVVEALAKAANSQVYGHRWVVAYAGQEDSPSPWGAWHDGLDEPRLCTQLDQAATVAAAAQIRAPQPPVRYTPQPPAHKTLADVSRTRSRPAAPALRQPDIGR